MNRDGVKFLISLGMKEKLLEKLSKEIIDDLVSFAIDHSTIPNISMTLAQLAFMELNGKLGALKLASHGVATLDQLKNLSELQISEILIDYNSHKDEKISIKNVKKALISGQQEKLYFESGGLKGEYHTQNEHDDADDEEAASDFR